MCRDRVWPWLDFLSRNKIFLCHDRVGQGEKDLRRDIVFLCCDGALPWLEFLFHDRVFSRRDRVDHGEEKLCRKRVFCARQSLALDGVFHVAT